MANSTTTGVGIMAATIAQLRTYCPLLGNHVAGAAEFRLGLQGYNTAPRVLPYGYVVPLGSDADGPGSMTGIYEQLRITTGIIVEFSAKEDRRGQDPAMDTEAMEAALNSALLNWEPVECLTVGRQGYWLAGSRFLDLDRARLFYQWEYALNTILTDDDGFHPDTAVPLLGIELDIWKVPDHFPAAPPSVIAEIDTVEGEAPPDNPWPPGPFLMPAARPWPPVRRNRLT
jgi:hypothetical protein